MSPTPIADLAQQLLQKIRIDQERRDKLLKLKFEKEDKKFKWNESDIDVNATVNYVKACQELHAQQKIDYATKLSENEVEYRNQMQLPFFVDFFFEIEEELFPELTEEALNLVNYVWDSTGNESEIFADEFSIQIKRHDLNTLRGLNWLNDEVINFYLNLIMQRSENHRDLPKVYVFNTFFLKTLNSRGYAGVKRWTRKVDIFDFDVLLIPVHLGNHWCLSVIDMKAREINYFDSLGGTNHGCLETLKNYLLEEHRDKKKSELNLSSWSFECRSEIPRQMNGSDCGVFTCCFAELSSRRLDFKFDQRIMPYYRQRMVYEICQKKLMV
ncbi:hypothetical protein M3Y97_00436000 [Aphelenchoides bicaudatus]|nr:hypothetical protein M3Y97_00436000 [Aphelenchoides bicaudatus]